MNWFFKKDKKDKKKKGAQPEAEAAEVVAQESAEEAAEDSAIADASYADIGAQDEEAAGSGEADARVEEAEVSTPEVSEAAISEPTEPVKKGFFARLKEGMAKTRNQLASRVEELLGMNRELNDEFYEELEELLLASDLGVKTTMAVVEELRKRIPQKHLREAAQVKAELKEILIERMEQTLEPVPKPAILMVVGVNGVGKTTSIGKMAHLYRQQGRNVLIAAADTFRAAAAEQLTMWAERAQVPIIRHEEGADPAAVVFDAIHAARARQADLLIVDTAGRLQNKKHLMEELRKMTRIAEREWQDAKLLTWLVIDATTGQNGINQAREFQAVSQLDGLIVSKLDGTAKGGVAVSVRGELGVPVRFVAVGERIDDLQPFDPRAFVEAML